MQYTMDCQANITAQDADNPTYKKIDCDLHTNANDVGSIKTYSFVGGTGYAALKVLTVVQTGASGGTFRIDTVDGNGVILTMTRLDKGIYYTVANNLATTVDTGEGTGATISVLTINTGFYGKLIDCTLVITNIIVDACRSWGQGIRLVVTIGGEDVSAALIGNLSIQHNRNMISTASLNLGDTIYSPRTNSKIDLEKEVVITAYVNGQEKKLFTGLLDEPEAENTPAFIVILTSRDYGKKLLDKETTLISVQDSAISKKRNDVIKYLAEQAGVTNVDIPEMDLVTIDNSFHHQSVWDMIQKEAMVELYWVKFSEDNVMQLKLDEIKSDTTLYPDPDWTYNEDRFIRLSYKKPRIEINKIAVLGKTSRREVIIEEFDKYKLIVEKEWEYDEDTSWDETIGSYHFKYTNERVWPESMQEVGEIEITRLGFGATESLDVQITGSAMGALHTYGGGGQTSTYKVSFIRFYAGTSFDHADPLRIAGINIWLSGYDYSTTEEIRYDQISAQITDTNSIAKYGERDGGSIEYPFLETQEQCVAVGEKIIRNSHRLGLGSFEVPFNPLIQVGDTIALNDTKIGLTERYYVEGVGHNIGVDEEGKIRARTQVEGIYYV